MILACLLVVACGDDDVIGDGDDEGDAGPDDRPDGGRGVSGSGGIFDLDAGFRDAGRDAGANDDDAGDPGPDDEDAGDVGDAATVSCAGDADCNDSNVCTDDSCSNQICANTAIDPDDGDACTEDSCDPDTGVHNDAIVPDDDDACTTDSCDPVTGVHNDPISITDNNACTVDSCNAGSGAITHAPATVDDSNACTADSCSPTTGIAHTPVAVDDSDDCTADSCTAPGGAIVHAFCSSGLCDTSEVCLNLTTTPFSDTPALGIPTGPAVISDTIVVSGVGTRLWDVNVRTTITHTFAGDLDITLRSPAGTIVTLTTDNGSANTFNGTVWDDEANPSGLAPYTANAGMVTDHPYTAGVTATPLVPEEALGAFIGENPNGTWTLTISDDEAGDGGSLTAWGIDLTTSSSAPTVTVQTFTQSTPAAIADLASTTSTLLVPAHASGSKLCSLTVSTNITHTFAGDLDVTLTSPAGTVVTLTTDNGLDADNVYAGTLWDDNANASGQVPYDSNNGLVSDHFYADLTVASPLAPEEALSAFIGDTVVGTWTLTVADDSSADTGALQSWALNIGRCLR